MHTEFAFLQKEVSCKLLRGSGMSRTIELCKLKRINAEKSVKQKRYATRYISKLSDKLKRKVDMFSRGEEFSASQGKILYFLLFQSRSVSQKKLEEEYMLRPSTVTDQLSRLEKKGLIRRELYTGDKRQKKIVVTEKGQQYKERVLEDVRQLEEELTKGIPVQDLQVFFRVMEQMLQNLS